MPSDKRNDNAPAELDEIRQQFKPIEALVVFVPHVPTQQAYAYDGCEGCVAEHDAELCGQLQNRCKGGVFKLELSR